MHSIEKITSRNDSFCSMGAGFGASDSCAALPHNAGGVEVLGPSCQGTAIDFLRPGFVGEVAAQPACWACGGTKMVTTSSNGSGLIDEKCLACDESDFDFLDDDDDDGQCPTCGEDGGTSCGSLNCGLLSGSHPKDNC
jgi:hypothetical protein